MAQERVLQDVSGYVSVVRRKRSCLYTFIDCRVRKFWSFCVYGIGKFSKLTVMSIKIIQRFILLYLLKLETPASIAFKRFSHFHCLLWSVEGVTRLLPNMVSAVNCLQCYEIVQIFINYIFQPDFNLCSSNGYGKSQSLLLANRAAWKVEIDYWWDLWKCWLFQSAIENHWLRSCELVFNSWLW